MKIIFNWKVSFSVFLNWVLFNNQIFLPSSVLLIDWKIYKQTAEHSESWPSLLVQSVSGSELGLAQTIKMVLWHFQSQSFFFFFFNAAINKSVNLSMMNECKIDRWFWFYLQILQGESTWYPLEVINLRIQRKIKHLFLVSYLLASRNTLSEIFSNDVFYRIWSELWLWILHDQDGLGHLQKYS